MCRDHEAPPVARGEAPVAAGVVEPTERTPPSTGCHRRGRDACPHEPGLPLPPRLVRFAQRTGGPLSAAHAARVLALVGWLRIDRGEACVLVGWAAIGAGRGVGVMDEQAQGLLDVAAGVLGELDLEVVIDRLLESARELTGAQYAALGVLDASRTELERFIAVGIDETVRREIGALPHGKGVLGELIRDPVPLRLSDVGEHPRSYGLPLGHPPMRSFLGVPILVGEVPFGSLYLTEKTGGGEFTDIDEASAMTLARFAGVAIDHARRYTGAAARGDELARTVAALEATTEIARVVAGTTDLDLILDAACQARTGARLGTGAADRARRRKRAGPRHRRRRAPRWSDRPADCAGRHGRRRGAANPHHPAPGGRSAPRSL